MTPGSDDEKAANYAKMSGIIFARFHKINPTPFLLLYSAPAQ